MKTALSAAILLLASAGALAAEAPGIAVTDAWSRATPPGSKTGVVYMTITDTGAADTLTAVSTPVAETAQVHESKTIGGVMQMRPIDAVPVSPAAPLQLAPNGYHVMLEGLKQPLKAGDAFPVTLTFAQAGAVTATVEVRSLGARSPVGHHDMDGMTMGQDH
jgi:periplasmic copper chaperone A